MKLSEKIIYCRKKAGLSQLDLADKLGVSRQSVSKWETGESNPDVTKIPLLAKEFGISADWLLSEDEPEEPQTADAPQTAPTPYPDWIEQLPSHLGKMVKKFGWLYGVRVAVGGGIITLFGCLSRAMFRSMLQPVSPFAGIIPGPISESPIRPQTSALRVPHTRTKSFRAPFFRTSTAPHGAQLPSSPAASSPSAWSWRQRESFSPLP